MKIRGVLRNSVLAIFLFALVCPAAQRTQGNKSKETVSPAPAGQRLEPMTQTQGEAGQEAGDQTLVYRFRLDFSSAASQLAVLNDTQSAGTFTLFAQEPDGSFSRELKRSLAPGEAFTVSASEAGWSPSNLVSIKASRRLRLSLQFPDEAERTEIARDPSVALYDVFSFERQSELDSSEKKRQLALLFSNRGFSQQLSPETTPQQGVSELLQRSGSSPSRGLFVLHATK